MSSERPEPADGFGPDTYGRSFADVYDLWYPPDDSTEVAVRYISSLAGPGGIVLELGVGTGRLAMPLAAAGHRVIGLDSSPEMLELLRRKSADDGRAPAVESHLVDLADSGARWPEGPVDVVVAAFNLICNMIDPSAQEALFRRSAELLSPGGHMVVETFLSEPVEEHGRHIELREVTVDAVVLIASDTDPTSSVITGQHIELRDGEPVRLRPWQLRVTSPDELDRWAAAAGLETAAVRCDWNELADDVDDSTHQSATRIAVYRKAS